MRRLPNWLKVILQFIAMVAIFALVLWGLSYVAFLLVKGLGETWGFIACWFLLAGIMIAMNEFNWRDRDHGKK